MHCSREILSEDQIEELYAMLTESDEELRNAAAALISEIYIEGDLSKAHTNACRVKSEHHPFISKPLLRLGESLRRISIDKCGLLSERSVLQNSSTSLFRNLQPVTSPRLTIGSH